MPEERQAPRIEDLNLESEPLRLGVQVIEDAYALSTVKQTFWQYEWYRSQNHDPRWNAHEALYLGWLPPKVWEGTTTPRSSLGMPVTFSQVESAFPAIYQALFNDDQWFQVSAEPGAGADEAKAIEAHLKYSLEHPRADYTGNSEIELELAIKQGLIDGNGGIKLEYDVKAGHPRISWVNLKDFYIDPGAVTSSVDSNRSIIERVMLTIDDIEDLRVDPRMRIPPKPVLVNMARNMQYVYADKTKQIGEALRGIQYNPGQHDTSPVPAERKIECLIYHSKHRQIWVFNREWVAYNERNPYGFIPVCFFPCFPIPGRFYAMSYADIIESPQRYIEALYNARLDELSLALRPPRVRKRGAVLTPSQQRWSPGAVQEADDPQKDINVLAPTGATQNIMGDIEYLENSVEKLTGVNGLGINGVPRPSNANRTATGVSAQAQGGSSRLWPIVKHIEDYLIVPMLYKMYRMVQVHTHPGQLLPALGQDDNHMQVGAAAFQQPVRFTINASSKMLTREKLAQVVPFLAQYVLNGPFIQGLQATGQTVDFDVFAQMVQDSTGTANLYKLFRPMNQQEMQQKQAPPPQLVAQQQSEAASNKVRLAAAALKAQVDIQKAQLAQQPDLAAQQQAAAQADAQQKQSLLQMAAAQQKMQHDRMKATMDQQTAQQKMAMDQAAHQQKLQQSSQQAQQDMLLAAAQGRQQMQQADQQHQMSLQQTAQQGQLANQQAQMAGAQKIDQSRQLIDHKIDLGNQKAKLQAQAFKQRATAGPKKPVV
jgi:hypothetical protein